MAKRESALEKRFHEACKKHGVKTIKVDPDNINGFPDRIVFNKLVGDIHYIEFKNNTYYDRTRNQKNWARIVKKCGGTYFLIDGDDDADAYLEKYIYHAEKVEPEETFLKDIIDLTHSDGHDTKRTIREKAKQRLIKKGHGDYVKKGYE